MLFSTVNSEHSRVSMFECFSHQRKISYSSRVALEKREKIIKQRKTNFVTNEQQQQHHTDGPEIVYVGALELEPLNWSSSLELRRECCFVVDNDERRAWELELYVNGNFSAAAAAACDQQHLMPPQVDVCVCESSRSLVSRYSRVEITLSLSSQGEREEKEKKKLSKECWYSGKHWIKWKIYGADFHRFESTTTTAVSERCCRVWSYFSRNC